MFFNNVKKHNINKFMEQRVLERLTFSINQRRYILNKFLNQTFLKPQSINKIFGFFNLVPPREFESPLLP